MLTQLHPSISLSDRVMVGAALSREFIAHECAPTEIEVLTQLHLSISLSDRVMVGAALSRECIAHECAPTEIAYMSGEKVSSRFSSVLLEFCG
jgi:hypothetical protein